MGQMQNRKASADAGEQVGAEAEMVAAAAGLLQAV
jgi:hypothetical protein